MSDRDLVTPEEAAADDARRAAAAAEKDERRRRRPVQNTTKKGKRGERTAVTILERAGCEYVRRQPRSGSIEGLPHDAVGQLADGTVSAEAKQFATSKWKSLDTMRDGADLLVLCLDQQAVGELAPEPKLFMPARTLQRLVDDAYRRGVESMRWEDDE